MRVAIHCLPDRQFTAWLWRVERFLQANGIPVERVCSSSPDFWEDITRFSHYIHLWGQWDRSEQEARTILPIIEEDWGLKCFPNRSTCRMFDDKPQESLFMQAHNLPTPRSWLFWDKHIALDWAEAAPLPLVFKLSGGAGSSNVQLIKTRSQLRSVIRRMFTKGCHSGHDLQHQGLMDRTLETALRTFARQKRRICNQTVSHDLAVPNWQRHRHYVYFQEFVSGNNSDTRVLTVGSKAFGFVRKNRKNDFRASGSGSADYRPERIDTRFVRMALDISRSSGFQTMAYDFLLDAGQEPTIVEMSYAFADWSANSCPGHWNAEIEWQEGRSWPQKHLLESLLEIDNLEVPPDLNRFAGYASFSMKDYQQ